MHTCSRSATRTPPSRRSATAAASVIPPVWLMKVRATCAPPLRPCCHTCRISCAPQRLWLLVPQLVVVLPGGEAGEDTAQEDFRYKLKGFIDSTVDKRSDTRATPRVTHPAWGQTQARLFPQCKDQTGGAGWAEDGHGHTHPVRVHL